MPEDAKGEKAMLVRIASTPSVGGGTMATGADVSRFQRSTVPGKAVEAVAAGGGSPSTAGSGGFPGANNGPVIHIARGNSVTDVPVGGKK